VAGAVLRPGHYRAKLTATGVGGTVVRRTVKFSLGRQHKTHKKHKHKHRHGA
jgi:hypothetical protein